MQGVQGKTRKRRFGISYLLLVVAVVTYLGIWGYSVLAADWKAKASIPKIDPLLTIIKGLRQYQKINATFPHTFEEVETHVWKHAVPPDFGANGHSLLLKNYYYLYTFISPTRCTLWAIPVGPRAGEASSYFLILTPTDREKYKGPPLDLKEASAISGTPTYAQLGMLGMIRQEPLPRKKR
jgi:hypothetical protein